LELLNRPRHVREIEALLDQFPVTALVGARQVGKSTLAAVVGDRYPDTVTRFDLEDPRDRARLADPILALEPLRGLVILDEIQHLPDVFSVLRVLADRGGAPARFLVLGSAGPDLLRQTAESLAGRIAYHVLEGLRTDEVPGARDRLWVRGGFPRSYLAASEERSVRWRRAFISTFLARDLPELGIGSSSDLMRRFWTMLAHGHGQTLNASAIGRSLGVSDTTVRRYLDLLGSTYAVRQLAPWHENLRKRQVRSPKVYIADTGVLHTLLGLDTQSALEGHPRVGASWESFVIENLIVRLGAPRDRTYFWATHAGAELDLLVVHGTVRRGFEVKRTVSPGVTPSMRIALDDLHLDSIEVLHAGGATFPLAERIRAVAVDRLWEDVEPL
jgi:predicted AAA+ superfamily ATPase